MGTETREMDVIGIWPDKKESSMGNIDELKHENKGLWVVLDEDGWPIYCAGWPEACHEHINEAINDHDIDGAAKWKVRRAELVPNAQDQADAA